MNNHLLKIKDSVLHSSVGLQPIEVVQLKNLSFDLKTTEEPCMANGYKRKESIEFFPPSEAELIEVSKFINGLNNGTITYSDYIR